MKGILLVAGITGIILTSCGTNSSKNDNSYIDSSLIPATKAVQTTGAAAQNNIIPVQPQVIPVNNPAMQQTIQQSQATATTVTAPGMNPPHGQPGHRCDIAVGAPLNSKPNPQAAVATQTQQPVNATLVQQPLGKTAPGMNPPHGQPGHRCDIAVGAPLNSKPVNLPVAQPVKATMTQEPAKKDSGS